MLIDVKDFAWIVIKDYSQKDLGTVVCSAETLIRWSFTNVGESFSIPSENILFTDVIPIGCSELQTVSISLD